MKPCIIEDDIGGKGIFGYTAYATSLTGKKKCKKTMYQSRLEEDNRGMNITLAISNAKGSGIPGPRQAALAMRNIEKLHYETRKRSLANRRRDLISKDLTCKELTELTAETFSQRPKVDCWMDYSKFRRYSSLVGNQKSSKQRECEAEEAFKEFQKKLRSWYGMKHNAEWWAGQSKTIAHKMDLKCPSWYDEYTSQVGGLRPKRKAPPFYDKVPLTKMEEEAKRRLHSCLVQTIYL